MPPYRPHDLLRLRDPDAVLAGAPPWVHAALARAPWVVVRRAAAPAGRVAVGVRGHARHERYAAVLPVADVDAVVGPESLRAPATPAADELPALRALRACGRILGDLRWGPTGSVGFELATGRATVTPESDLDLVVRTDALPSPARAADLRERLARLPARVDCQLDTAAGAVALAELAAGPDTILVRTSAGPALVRRCAVSGHP